MTDADTDPRSTHPVFSLRGLGKRYATWVLRDVDLDIYPGEVHALIGANGAGKSTLVRIVSGLVQSDAGSMTLTGKPYSPQGKATAERAGIQIVQQELNLIGTLTVAENLMLNRLPRRLGVICQGQLDCRAREALALVGLADLDPRTPIDKLGVGQQQLVEIAAALARQCSILALDEPTAALTGPQVDQLFEQIRRLKQAGVAVIYVSHRMEEIRRIADRASILRDGRLVATRPVSELSVDQIVQLMVGREVIAESRPREHRLGEVAMRINGLSRGGAVRDVTLAVRRGELLGLAGLIGSGRTELLRAVFGADRADHGSVRVGGGRPRRFHHPAEAVRAGVAMIPEDRKQHGLMLPCSVRENVTLGSLARFARRWIGWVHRRGEAEEAARQTAVMDVHCESIEQRVAWLSGGNQQKVLIARWLLHDAEVILFDEPTRGIDVGTKAAIYHLLNDLAARGKALVVVSSDLRELMSICDRIAVMSAGRIAATFDRGEWTQDKIMAAAISGYLQRKTGQHEH
ncbi:MAG: sugar ABC transporter ATP-binding protein [Planctomycetota bacterium]